MLKRYLENIDQQCCTKSHLKYEPPIKCTKSFNMGCLMIQVITWILNIQCTCISLQMSLNCSFSSSFISIWVISPLLDKAQTSYYTYNILFNWRLLLQLLMKWHCGFVLSACGFQLHVILKQTCGKAWTANTHQSALFAKAH